MQPSHPKLTPCTLTLPPTPCNPTPRRKPRPLTPLHPKPSPNPRPPHLTHPRYPRARRRRARLAAWRRKAWGWREALLPPTTPSPRRTGLPPSRARGQEAWRRVVHHRAVRRATTERMRSSATSLAASLTARRRPSGRSSSSPASRGGRRGRPRSHPQTHARSPPEPQVHLSRLDPTP